MSDHARSRPASRSVPLPVPMGRAGVTPRLAQMWSLLALGYSNAAIAEQLHLSQKWTDNALSSLYSVLEIDTKDPGTNPRVQAALLYLEHWQGLLPTG